MVFVGVNALGARASGRTGNVLVGPKVLILLVFGAGGLYFGYTTGVLTTGLGVLGNLNAISSFASLAFSVLFGAMSCLAFRERGGDLVTAAIPAVGVLGAIATVVALVYHLVTTELTVFATVLVLVVAVVGVELPFFERDP